MTVSNEFDMDRSSLWARVGHPGLLAAGVPMLAEFQAPPTLSAGCGVSELHTILGWPQIYRGRIVRYDEGHSWSMQSRPAGWSPCPLPHTVLYRIMAVPDGRSALSITCAYECGGVLAWPLVPGVVHWYMRRTLNRLLSAVC